MTQQNVSEKQFQDSVGRSHLFRALIGSAVIPLGDLDADKRRRAPQHQRLDETDTSGQTAFGAWASSASAK